jgi:hypothetical protein
MRRAKSRTSKAGFTLIEALITLALTSLTVGVLFTIGARGGTTGFRMGARALDVADAQLAGEAFRATVASFLVPPLTTVAQTGGGTEDDATLTTFLGDADHVEGQWLAARASPCAVIGATGHLVLAINRQADKSLLTCQLDDADPIVLVDFKGKAARFQYSEDGVNWVDAWTVEAGQQVADSARPSAEQRKVYVRAATDDGSADLVEIAASGRAVAQGQTNGG